MGFPSLFVFLLFFFVSIIGRLLILYPATLLKVVAFSRSFLVESLGYLIYGIICKYLGLFYSHLYLLFHFFCLIALARNSSTVFYRSSNILTLILVTVLQVFLFRVIVGYWFLIYTFIRWDLFLPSLLSFYRNFIMSRYWTLLDHFFDKFQ